MSLLGNAALCTGSGSVNVFIFSVKVLEVVMFLATHNLAGGGDKIAYPYVAISRRYDQLRSHGQERYVQIRMHFNELDDSTLSYDQRVS